MARPTAQAARVIEKQLPAGDQMSATEAAYFESGGEEGGPEAGTAPATPAEPQLPLDPPAAASETDPSADPAAAAVAPVQDGKPPKGFVPHGAFHEAREGQKAERELRLAAEKRAQTLEERTNLILQRMGQPAQPAPVAPQQPVVPEIPPADTDPLGHVLARLKIAEERAGQVENYTAEQRQQREQVSQVQQLTTNAVALEQDFAATNPDYHEAAAYLQNSRRQEYTAMGYNPMQVNQAIQQEALQIAAMAMQRGQNPAEVIYTLSKTRGFAKAAPAAQATPAATQAQPANGAVEQIQRVTNGQNQNQSLGNTRGSAPAPLTADRLLKMSDDDFAKALSTPEGLGLMGS